MNNLLKQSLILGTLFEIVSYILDLFDSALLDAILFVIFIYFFIKLIILKELRFINKVVTYYPRISTYMKYLGWTWYSNCIVFVVGTTDGYRATMAKFNNIEYSYIAPHFIMWFLSIYIILAIICFIYATYINFFKKVK